mgnify:CR=1 FL=1|jgi:3-oxoacyl-ACP reductase-like protein
MGVAELPRVMDALARRASTLRDALGRSQGNTESTVAILGSFDHRLSALEAAMRPTQVPPLPPFPVRFDLLVVVVGGGERLRGAGSERN